MRGNGLAKWPKSEFVVKDHLSRGCIEGDGEASWDQMLWVRPMLLISTWIKLECFFVSRTVGSSSVFTNKDDVSIVTRGVSSLQFHTMSHEQIPCSVNSRSPSSNMLTSSRNKDKKRPIRVCEKMKFICRHAQQIPESGLSSVYLCWRCEGKMWTQ